MPRSDLLIPLIAISTALLGCMGEAIVAPAVGNILVITATQGTDRDAEYTIRVDTGESRHIAAGASLTLSELTPEDHTVELADVAPNCSIGGENPRVVEVQPDQTAEVTFSVTCTSTTGIIVLRSFTSGAFPDPDGYTVTVNGSRHDSLQAQDASHIERLVPASYLVEIGGIAANCRLADGSSRMVPVSAGGTAVVDFAVDCSSPPPIAFTNNAWGGGIISLVNPDGSGQTRISQQQTGSHRPVWSPDGSKIAFGLDDLYIMNPDGTGLTRLTTGLWVLGPWWFGRDYRWAPDGSTIAVCARDCEICDSHIWLARTDGSGATRLAEGSWPSWSPDGSAILFFNSEGAFTVRPDGSGLTRLDVAVSPYYGVWSPDGDRIALIAGVIDGGYASAIFVVNRDGSGLVKLTQEGWDESDLAWSPDGSRIALQSRPREAHYQDTEIDIVMADGTGRRRLTADPQGGDSSPAWSPDGSQIAFVKVTGPLADEDVYVISAEGGVPVNVSNNPRVSDLAPSWSSR